MSNLRRVGLPEAMRMRHDVHFVDQLGRPGGAPVGRLIPIEDIDPNPNQPRHTMGDLSELIASVREKGILEPILVRPRGNRFQIIAGERRFRAAGEAQLSEIPCIVRETPDAEMMELALIENLQRKDLTPFEEAEALHSLADRCGYTHEDLAQRLGKSRTSITESLALKNPGRLTIGTDSPAFEPWFSDNDPSNGEGFESAVAYAVAEELGFSDDQVDWVKVPFNNSYAPGEKDFDFDINQISITPERAEVVDFMKRFIAQDVQCAMGGVQASSRISPNVNVGEDCYANDILADASVVLTDALKSGSGRFDASDLMPAAVGQGSFWTEMVNYVKNGPEYLETALTNIENSWPK